MWFYRPPKYDSYRTIKMGKTIESILRKAIESILRKAILERKKQMLMYEKYYTRTYVTNENMIVQASSDVKGSISRNNAFMCKRKWRIVNPKTVMERLGHKDINTTLQTYTFNTDLMASAAADIFENAVNE